MVRRRLLDSGMRPHGPRRYRPERAEVVAEETIVPALAPPAPPTEAELPPADATTIVALMEWVNLDANRAQTVLDLENEKKEADRRKSLISQLTDLIQTDLV